MKPKVSAAPAVARLLSVVACLLPLFGCGIVGLCSNSCPSGWVHGSFDCGCMQVSQRSGTLPAPKPYYIARRYSCKNVSNGSDAGTCDSSVNADSCQEAVDTLNSLLSQRDPCQNCNNDNTKYWD